MKAIRPISFLLLILLIAPTRASGEDIAVTNLAFTPERDSRLLQRPWPRPGRGQISDYAPSGLSQNQAHLDWRDNGGNFVSGIRDQGDCATGWLHAATGTMESAFLITHDLGQGIDFNLSESQALSCLPHYGFSGDCEAGWPEDLLWMGLNVGLVEESVSPWTGQANHTCSATEKGWERRHYLAGHGYVCYRADIEAIKDALFKYGPLLTTMTVHEGFESYSGGIHRGRGAITGYHAVVIVGYDDQLECFIAKNSWGESWGEGGYFRVAYNSGCDFGNWSCYAELEDETGPYAAMRIDVSDQVTGAEVVFNERALPGDGEIIAWEWDLDGDWEIDHTGPGPHTIIYIDPGQVSPALRITTADGRQDELRLIAALKIRFSGPVWRIDAEDGSDYGDGSRATPLKSIQLGLDRAADGDTIMLAPGRYRGIMNTALNLRGKSLTLLGQGEPGDVVIDGGGEDRLLLAVYHEGGALVAENIEFRNGASRDLGSAVQIKGGSAVFRRCGFVGNQVASETGYGGGAIWLDGNALFESCRFLGNLSATDGGAITSTGGLLELDGCRFQGNSARARGGAVCVTGGVLTAVNTVLLGNSSAFGAALYLIDSQVSLRHLSLVNNEANQAGGGLALLGRESILMANSILWDNRAPRDPEILAPGLDPGALRHCLISGGFSGVEILDENPLFMDLKAGDLRLRDGSPCLARGASFYAGPSDIDGESRPTPSGSRPDLGAFESQAGVLTAVTDEIPRRVELTGIFPNPFNPTTSFSFSMLEPAAVKLQIYLPTGRLVATPVDEPLSAGEHHITWTAVDEQGELLPSGVFLIRLECRYENGELEERIGKATLVK